MKDPNAQPDNLNDTQAYNAILIAGSTNAIIRSETDDTDVTVEHLSTEPDDDALIFCEEVVSDLEDTDTDDEERTETEASDDVSQPATVAEEKSEKKHKKHDKKKHKKHKHDKKDKHDKKKAKKHKKHDKKKKDKKKSKKDKKKKH